MKGALTFCAECRRQVRASKCVFLPDEPYPQLHGRFVCNDCIEKEED